jgi:hypothetical protein
MFHPWLRPDRLDEIQKAMIRRARVKFGPIYPMPDSKIENDFTKAPGGSWVFWFHTEDGSSHCLMQESQDTPTATAVKE